VPEGAVASKRFHLLSAFAFSREAGSHSDGAARGQAVEAEGASPATAPGSEGAAASPPAGTRIGQALLTVLTVQLAALPSWLVVWDRWLGHALASPALNGWWSKVPFLRDLNLPPYFLLVFACFPAVLILVWSNKHNPVVVFPDLRQVASALVGDGVPQAQSLAGNAVLLGSGVALAAVLFRTLTLRSLPGWELAVALLAYVLGWALREISVQGLLDVWRKKQDLLLSLVLAHLALIALLEACTSRREMRWLPFLLFVLAALNLLRHRPRLHPVFWITSLALVLSTLELSRWWFSVVGDEYSFFQIAKRILEQESLSVIGSKLFLGVEVFGSHPYLSSLIQAVSMKVLGVDNFGWRFSSIYVSAVSIGLFYYFFRAFVSRSTALLACTFLAASHYLMNFAKIGYNNTQALLAMSLALAASVWAVRSKGPLSFASLGLALGFCFYVYPAALYVLPIPGLLLVFFAPPRSRPMAGRWVVLLVSVLLCIFPLFLQRAYWESKRAGTLLADPELAQNVGAAAIRHAKALAYAAVSFVYAIDERHFVASSYVDPLSAALVIVGLSYILTLALKARTARFLLLSFGLLLVLLGATHGEVSPPTTRAFLLLPWWALFAAVGLTWIGEQIANVLGGRWYIAGFWGLVMCAILTLNLYQAYVLAPPRMERYQNEVTLYLRMVMQAQAQHSDPMPTFVFITDPGWSPEGISDNLHPVYFPDWPPALKSVVVTGATLPAEARALIADPNALVVIKPWLTASWRSNLEDGLRSLGKVPCDIKTLKGTTRFQLWHSGGWGMLCG